MKTAFHFLIAALLLLVSTPLSRGGQSAVQDEVEECADWAAQGECNLNPKYMQENCAASCKYEASKDKKMKNLIGK